MKSHCVLISLQLYTIRTSTQTFWKSQVQLHHHYDTQKGIHLDIPPVFVVCFFYTGQHTLWFSKCKQDNKGLIMVPTSLTACKHIILQWFTQKGVLCFCWFRYFTTPQTKTEQDWRIDKGEHLGLIYTGFKGKHYYQVTYISCTILQCNGGGRDVPAGLQQEMFHHHIIYIYYTTDHILGSLNINITSTLFFSQCGLFTNGEFPLPMLIRFL